MRYRSADAMHSSMWLDIEEMVESWCMRMQERWSCRLSYLLPCATMRKRTCRSILLDFEDDLACVQLSCVVGGAPFVGQEAESYSRCNLTHTTPCHYTLTTTPISVFFHTTSSPAFSTGPLPNSPSTCGPKRCCILVARQGVSPKSPHTSSPFQLHL